MIVEISIEGQIKPVRVRATQLSVSHDNGTVVALATAFGFSGGIQASVAGNSDFQKLLALLEVPRDRWPRVTDLRGKDPAGLILAKS